MSNVTRRGLQFIVNQIGNAKYAFKDLVGDNVLNRGLVQKMDSISVKIRGSKYFNDYDLSNKDVYGINDPTFSTYDDTDNLNITLQGGDLKVDYKQSFFYNFGSWTPFSYNVPCLEGWQVYDYNAWSNYIPKFDSSGAANTNYIIYDIYNEPISGLARKNFDYPIRYNGTTYSRVPLFNYAKWISAYNDSGSIKDEVHLVVPKTEFSDLFRLDPSTELPIDLAIYSHPYLSSNVIDNTLSLDGAMGLQNISDQFEKLSFEISLCDSNGDTVDLLKYFLIKVNLPGSMNFADGKWCHLAFYWGTFDDFYKTGYPTYFSGSASTYVPTDLEDRWYTFPKVSYFRKELLNFTAYNKTGINDTNVYLYSGNKTFFQRIDGQYIPQTVPFRYRLDDNIIYSGSGLSSNINTVLGDFEYLPLIVASKNYANKYDNPKNDYYVFMSSPVPSNEIPTDWNNYELFPSVNEDYDILAKIVVTKSSNANIDTPSYISDSNFVNNGVSITYLEMVVDNSIKAPLGDEDVFFYFYNALVADSNSFKNVFFDNILDTLNFALTVPAARMSTANIKTPFVFKNTDQNYYLQLHNLIKFPTNSLIATTNDPKAIQFDKNGLKILSDWNALSPSNDFAFLNTDNSYISDLKLNLDNEFEIYQENTTGYNISDINDAGTKIGKDYSFKVKFEDTSFTYLTKEFFVNSSKYLLSDSDYALRISQNLPIKGYYKKGTYSEQQNVSQGVLQNIDDYRVYGYSKVIPDLEMGASKTITTQEVEPIDSNKITRSDYIAQLKASNSLISEEQINAQIQNYLLTSSFYNPDSNKYSNKFAEIKSVGVTISEYSTLSTKWMNNSSLMWGENINSKFKAPEHVLDLRYDSFLIAGSGYTIHDGTLDNLENLGDFKITVGEASIGQTEHNGSKKISTEKIAFKVSPTSTADISSFRLKFQNTSIFNNPSTYAKCEIWDSYSGLPNTVLASGTKVYISNITNTYDDYEFDISYKLHESRDYWFVINFNNNPPLYDTNILGKINVNDSAVTGIYNRATDSVTNFEKYLSGSELGIGSTLPSNITNWYAISSIGSSSTMTVSGTGMTVSSQDYTVRYNFNLGILESSIGVTTPYNIAEFTSSGWALTQGTAYVKFYKPDEIIYGGFNKDFTNNTNILPSPNFYRESLPEYHVDDYWSWNIEKIELPNTLYVYPRSTRFEQLTVAGYGTATNSYVEIKSVNWNNKILAGMAISTNYSLLSAGSAITGIGYSSISGTYLLHLDQVVPYNFDQDVYIGSIGSTYLMRSEDINLKIRYLKNGAIQDKVISLPHASTWNTYYYLQNSHTYNHLDKTVICDLKKSSYNISSYNYDVNGEQNYIAAYSKANITPKTGIGSTFEFRFTSSGGVRVYLNGNSLPSIDKWKTNGSTSSCSFGSTTAFDIEVQFWNKTSLPVIVGEWRIAESGNDWQNIDNSFYPIIQPIPVLIDEDVQQISYMSVSNIASDLDTQYMGMPPGDRFVLRSK